MQHFQSPNFFHNSVFLKLPDYKRYVLSKNVDFKILPLETLSINAWVMPKVLISISGCSSHQASWRSTPLMGMGSMMDRSPPSIHKGNALNKKALPLSATGLQAPWRRGSYLSCSLCLQPLEHSMCSVNMGEWLGEAQALFSRRETQILDWESWERCMGPRWGSLVRCILLVRTSGKVVLCCITTHTKT